MGKKEVSAQIGEEIPSADRSTEEDIRSTLLKLQERDRVLREALDGRFEDDGAYFALTAQIGELAEKAKNNLIEGYERARIMGLIAKSFAQLQDTERSKAEQDFIKTSREREEAGSQVNKLKKINSAPAEHHES